MKKFKLIVAIMTIVSMVFPLGSCAQEVEAAEFNGMLTSAVEDELMVNNATGSQTFVTNDKTAYDFNGQTTLSINDVLYVKYHKKGSKMIADEVVLKKHVEEELVFEGIVVDADDSSVTVKSDSLTVMFSIAENTSVSGDLSKGDKVRITYSGNLSEYPRAVRLKVTEENKKPENTVISGVVAEALDYSLLVSIDSATSRRFRIDKTTKISGKADKVKEGDSVSVTYKSDDKSEKGPLAAEIKITKLGVPKNLTMNGTIKSIGKDSVTLTTSKKTYSYAINDETKFKGIKPAQGCKAEITYYKDRDDQAVASAIYCEKIKDKKADPEPPAPAPTPKPVPVDPEPEPEQAISAKGTVVAWSGDESGECTVDIDGSGETLFSYNGDTAITSGYVPQEGDYINFLYMASNMTLTRIDLINRPDPQPQPDEDETAEPSKDESAEPAKEAEPAEEAKEEPEEETQKETKEEPEEETQKETKEEPVVESKAKPEEDVMIKAKGNIVSGDEKKKTIVISIEGGDKIELKGDKDTDIASGYFPSEGDKVQIVYNKNGMLLKDIQLIEAAKTKDEEKPKEAEESDQ